MRINCKRQKRSHWGDRNTLTLDCGVIGYDVRNQYAHAIAPELYPLP